MTQRSLKQWIWSLLNGCMLFALSILWTNTAHITGDEEYVVKWSSWIRDVIFRKSPNPESFLFVDVSHDKDIAESKNGMGVDVITDRRKLATFFSRIDHQHPTYRLILCDVSLTGHGRGDTALAAALKGLKRVVMATHFEEDGTLSPVQFKEPLGITNVTQSEGVFFKFNLFQDEKIPTLPIAMYQQLSSHHYGNYGPFHFDNSQLCFSTIIVDQRIRDYQVTRQRLFSFDPLWALLTESDSDLNQISLKNRIVVIGDFHNDRHSTIFGQTAGSLIMLNVYLALEKHLHLVSWWWVLFMFSGLTLVSKICVFHRAGKGRQQIRWLGPLVKDTALLTIFSVLAYLLFDRHVQVLGTLVYIYVVNFLLMLSKKPLTLSYCKTTIAKYIHKMLKE
jgi:hypothetical protein